MTFGFDLTDQMVYLFNSPFIFYFHAHAYNTIQFYLHCMLSSTIQFASHLAVSRTGHSPKTVIFTTLSGRPGQRVTDTGPSLSLRLHHCIEMPLSCGQLISVRN